MCICEQIWFDETQLPGIDVTRCSACQHQMRLLVQVYAPLDHQPHDRVLYIWGCNRRRCMRTQGCFRVIRAVQMNEAYARKLKKKNKPKKPPTTNVVSQPVKPSTSIGMGIGVSTSSNGTKSFSVS
jgi:pre-rRNA-processing protein TSR4